MNINISIDGVLRNALQKFEYHYKCFYLDSDAEIVSKPMEIGPDGEIIPEVEESNPNFNYQIYYPITNDNIKQHFAFQSDDEFNNFLYVEFPVEIYGQASVSYYNVITELNKLMFENQDINFTVVGMDELGKAKPSTLFFLSRNGFLGNNIRFIKSENLIDEWGKCDVWITDNKQIIESCPSDKNVIKFETDYNTDLISRFKIDKFSKIEITWLKSLENFITSI